MTAVIIHGEPGSYKTSAVLSDVLIPALRAGRVVVTNVRGIKSVEDIEEIYQEDFPETAEIQSVSFDAAGFYKMATFFHWVPEGALIIMDEAQQVYPTRMRSLADFDYPGGKAKAEADNKPETVELAFDTHRHRNWDIYCTTPSINKVHKEIRGVAEAAYRHKNLKSVLPFLSGRYKCVKHDAENSGKGVSYVQSSQIKKVDTKIFETYQSTATGKTTDSAQSFDLFGQPKLLVVLCIIGYVLYFAFDRVSSGQGLMPFSDLRKELGPDPTIGQNSKIHPDSTRRNGANHVPERHPDKVDIARILIDEIYSYDASIVTNKKPYLIFTAKNEEGMEYTVNSEELLRQKIRFLAYDNICVLISLDGYTRLIRSLKYELQEDKRDEYRILPASSSIDT